MAVRVWSFTVSDDGERLQCMATSIATGITQQYMEWYNNAPEAPDEGEDTTLLLPGWEVRRHATRDDAASELFTTLLTTFDQ